jgi:hypothetical protein
MSPRAASGPEFSGRPSRLEGRPSMVYRAIALSRASATPSFCLLPQDNSCTCRIRSRWSRSASSRPNRRSLAPRSRPSRPRSARPDMFSYSASSPGKYPISRRMAASRRGSSPKISASPLVGRISPTRQRSMVVLSAAHLATAVRRRHTAGGFGGQLAWAALGGDWRTAGAGALLLLPTSCEARICSRRSTS